MRVLIPSNITQVRFAEHLSIPIQRINEIVNGKRGITPETVWLFAKAFHTTPEFWLNLQMQYDLAVKRPDKKIKAIV
jgi:addiction module HigA family antidote